MAKSSPIPKIITKIVGYILGFLMWFIRLVTFVGDITIWTFKTAVLSFILAVKTFLHFDLRRVKLIERTRAVLHNPIIYQDRSFKVGLAAIAIIIFGVWYTTRGLPSPKQLDTRNIAQTTKILDRNGNLLFDIYTDQNRTIVPLSDIPSNLKNGTIAVEDKDFYKHKGFDILGILRAATKTAEGNLQGGSTITQQLVKSAFLSPERTITRKLKELYLAFRVEMAFPKDKILEMYLNQVPYGGTAFGVEAASEQYFGKHVQDLDLAQSALLAGLPQAPTYYSPYGQDPQRAKARQQFVLKRMVEEHYISQQEADKASAEPLAYKPETNNIKAPHFVMFVREYLAQKYGEDFVAKGGLKVTTTLDLNLQEKAQDIVKKNVDGLAYLHVTNGAALVSKPDTGEILAMVGSKDFFDTSVDGNVNVTVANRQPGSSIKPINYATALEHKLITPATIIMDVPTTFGVAGTKPYSPVNYDGKFHGPVTVRTALGNSFNIPAVKVLAINGVEAMIKQANAMGITTFTDPSRYGLSLTLGGGEVKMTDMATAFGVFANQGKRVDLTPILKIEDTNGNVLEKFVQKPGSQVLSPQTSFLISSILSDNGARTMEFGPASELVVKGKTVAVKTGTTDDKRDNWTIGYTPGYLTAVWVGNNDNTPMNQYLASGITGAAPIWNQIMTFVLADKVNESFNVPTGVVGINICGATGGAKNDSCPNNHFEYFISGTEPKQDTFTKAKVWVDKTTGQVVAAGSPNAEEQEQVIVKDVYQDKQYCVSCAQVYPSPNPSPSPSPNP